MKTLEQSLPLPKGVSHAIYIDGVREVVQYDIGRDENIVRYDWIEKDGQQSTFFAAPISPYEDFAEALALRREQLK